MAIARGKATPPLVGANNASLTIQYRNVGINRIQNPQGSVAICADMAAPANFWFHTITNM